MTTSDYEAEFEERFSPLPDQDMWEEIENASLFTRIRGRISEYLYAGRDILHKNRGKIQLVCIAGALAVVCSSDVTPPSSIDTRQLPPQLEEELPPQTPPVCKEEITDRYQAGDLPADEVPAALRECEQIQQNPFAPFSPTN